MQDLDVELVTDPFTASPTTNPGVHMQARRKGILFVCADATMLEVRPMLLERAGYEVWPTNSIEVATVIAQQNCPDMFLMEDGYHNSDLERAAREVKNVCPRTIAVVLAPYFAVRDTSHSTIDRFIARDQGPDVLLFQIAELFLEHNRQATAAPRASAV